MKVVPRCLCIIRLVGFYPLCTYSILMPMLAWGTPTELRQAVDSAYAQGQFERVELLVLRAQSQIAQMPLADRANINLTAGFALIMLERETDAREYFRRALDADPTIHLDPVRISPKFRVVFDDVKASYRVREDAAVQSSLSRPIMEGPRRSSVLANLLVPGAGQWHEGQKVRGAALFITQCAAVGVLTWRLQRLDQSRHAYVRERNVARVRSDYDRYARDMHLAWYAGIATGAVYLAAQTDLALSRRPASDTKRLVSLLSGSPLNNGWVIQWSVRW